MGHSLAADPTSNSTNADQASQIGDQAPDSVQSDPEQPADPGQTFNPKTIHSDSSDVLTLQVQFVPNLPAKNAEELSPNTILGQGWIRTSEGVNPADLQSAHRPRGKEK